MPTVPIPPPPHPPGPWSDPTTGPAAGPVAGPVPRRRALGLALCAALVGAAPRPARAGGGHPLPPPARPLPLALAREWPPGADPAGFLVSEKLDGVRAVWDGRRLRFRSGLPIAAPRWFLERLPEQPLDGELWLGRGRFEALAGLVRRAQPDEAGWRALQYQVFELPAGDGPFAARAESLRRLCAQAGFAALQALPQSPVADRRDLARRLAAVVAAGGEGLVLHQADAPLADGRAPGLFKHKPQHDAEAVVLAHLPGQGRLDGLLGALQVRDERRGTVFALGSGLRDAERQQPPPPGSRVTYRHRGYTADGVPRFATYLRPAP